MVIIPPGGATMSDASPAFTIAQWQLVIDLLRQRYGADVELDPIEVDVAATPDAEPAACPGLHWFARDAHFAVVSTADGTYRGQFFYDDELLGPGDRVFDDLADCVLALLRLQADHERQRRAAGTSVPAEEGRSPKREAA